MVKKPTRVSRTSDTVYTDQSADSGIYIGRVVSHLDQTFMGALRVQLLKVREAANDFQEVGQLITCHYASPFGGQTPLQDVGANNTYQETQQSYGFWAVPPDIGTKVIVVKVEGAADFGYWIGCVNDDFMNFMIPDGRAATNNNNEGQKLPVGEYNKALVDPDGELQPTRYPKPVNTDFVDALAEQGLLEDDIRGLTSSSARREVPSAVFGMSTPGPLDKRPGAPRNPRGPTGKEATMPSSRLGGTSIVMDDGDDKILRVGSAADTPSEYVDIENTDANGDITKPANELFRVRTRTGHQILLHNTEDLIYIGNARGTSWIEMTSNGKIDIYAEDSISVHTSQDINFSADRDINFNAAANINMSAGEKVKTTAGSSLNFTSVDYTAFTSGAAFTAKADSYASIFSGKKLSIEGTNNVDLVSNSASVNISASKTANIAGKTGVKIGSDSDLHLKFGGNIFQETNAYHVNSQEYFLSTKGGMHLNSAADMYLTSKVTMNVKGKSAYLTSVGGDTHVKSSADIKLMAAVDLNQYSVNNFRYTSSAIHDKAESSINVESAGTIDTKAATTLTTQSTGLMSLNSTANIQASGAQIHLNSDGNPASSATAATVAKSAVGAISAEAATIAIKPNPVTPQTPIVSLIAKIPSRVPQHEPWLQHENLNPAEYTPEKTRAGVESVDSFSQPIPDTFINIGTRDTTGTTTASDRGGISGSQNFVPSTDGEYAEETLGDFKELQLDQVYVVGDGHGVKVAEANGYKGSPRAGATIDQIAKNQVGRIPQNTVVIVAAGSNNWDSTPAEVAGIIQEEIIDPLLLKNCYVIVLVHPDINLAGSYASTYSSAGYTSNYNAVRNAIADLSANGTVTLSQNDIDSNDPQKIFATDVAYNRVATVVDQVLDNVAVDSPFDKFEGSFGPLLAAIRICEVSTPEPRGYDIVYGGIPDAIRPPRPITQMSIDDVLIWQKSIRGSVVSTASGAYQFIYTTLKDLVDRRKVVPRSAKMDAATQDRLALALMKNKNEWKEGNFSDEDFGYGLAKVWASMPVMQVGVALSKGTSKSVNDAYWGGTASNPDVARHTAKFIKEALVASKRGSDDENKQTEATIAPEDLIALGYEAGDPYEDLNERSAFTDAGSNIGELTNVDRVRQRQGGATFRKLPVQQQIIDILNRAAAATGVYVHITSGGQMPLDEFLSKPRSLQKFGRPDSRKNPPYKDFYLLNAEGDKIGARTGSRRHDTGLAVDCWITRNPSPTASKDNDGIGYNFGRQGQGADNQTWEQFIYHAFKNGCRGFGFASGYMGNKTIHLDTLGALAGSGYNSNTVGHWLTSSYFVNIARKGFEDS